jgi:hypothetical protein
MPTPSISPINLLINGLRSFMDLADIQVVLYNQKWRNPNDDRLYVVFALLSTKPYGNRKEYEQNPEGTALLENLSVNIRETYSIHIFSRNQDAMNRKEEILFFLNSDEAQQIQEAASFKLATLPVSFVDTSDTEGAGRINKFTITVNALRVVTTSRIVQYFDKFQIPPKNLFINP